MLLLAPLVTAIVTGDLLHLAGVPMVLVGLVGANPRLSPVGGGCLPLLVVVCTAIVGAWSSRTALFLVAWAVPSWLVASLELRRSVVPYVAAPGDGAD